MSTTEKIDVFKLHKAEYASPKKPVVVDTKPAIYMAVEGQGEPGGEEFQARIGALYGMAYTVKMTRKVEGRGDYTICKLEAQWWCGEDDPEIDHAPKDEWRWRMMIRTPDVVERSDLERAADRLKSKGKGAHVDDVSLQRIDEGRCVQMLHVGPYEREPETVAVMERFAKDEGLSFHGLHHEIYLSDPRRIPPERLKTILRRPVR